MQALRKAAGSGLGQGQRPLPLDPGLSGELANERRIALQHRQLLVWTSGRNEKQDAVKSEFEKILDSSFKSAARRQWLGRKYAKIEHILGSSTPPGICTHRFHASCQVIS